MADTERTIYVAVLVVEHAPGLGPELDGALTGVRDNLVTWLDAVLTDQDSKNDDGSLFYGVRDVTLYNAADFYAELRDHGVIDNFPDVINTTLTCCGCGDKFPLPADPATIEEDDCRWHNPNPQSGDDA